MSGIFTYPLKAPLLFGHYSILQKRKRRLPEVTNSYKVSISGLCSYQDPRATLTFSEFKGVPLAPFPAPIFKQGCDHFEGPRRRPPLTPQLRYMTHLYHLTEDKLCPYCSSQHSTQRLVTRVAIPRFQSSRSEFS